MKFVIAMLAMFAAAVSFCAEPVNLIKADGWDVINAASTEIKDGVITFTNVDKKVKSALVQTVELNQTQPEPFTFAAEAKAIENVGNSGCNFGMYVDIVYTDGTKTNCVNFGMGVDTFDWKLVSRVFDVKKPIKTARIVVQYLNNQGKVQFRNVQFYQGRVSVKFSGGK